MLKNWGQLFYWVLSSVMGAMLLALPARMARWTFPEHPERSNDPRVLAIMRVTGLGMLCAAGYWVILALRQP
jgi:hypothetical protein